jgi:CheY-like chemotaxis protein
MTKRILLVDDNKTIQELYRSRFAREHCHVTTVENGLDALKLLMAEPDHDLVILDLLVPVMDGYKVLQVIRSHPQLKQVPVLVFSAKSQAEEIDRAMAMGATDYLNKTTTKPDELVERVKQLLALREGGGATATPTTHYRLSIKDTALDAPRLASDFQLSPFFTCTKCENALEFDLTMQQRDPLIFRTAITCPRCRV